MLSNKVIIQEHINRISSGELRITIVGLGYVGLPICLEFGKIFRTRGIDINPDRISELNRNFDRNNEFTENCFSLSKFVEFAVADNQNVETDVWIVAVPTPIDAAKKPDLEPIVQATQFVARNLKAGQIVVFESTVYPGLTEEICVPILEKGSSLAFDADFSVAYSPERINPADKIHTIRNIVKVVSGNSESITECVSKLYETIIDAGIFQAKSIKVAEAAKVIENIQRDVNIALINELSIMMSKIGISIWDVLDAANTKWNFLDFKPGLVGGHCIGVDPYYLSHKANEIGFHSELILSGRRVNENMVSYFVSRLFDCMLKSELPFKKQKILVLGATFKENCPDMRNSKAVNFINTISKMALAVDVFDPIAENLNRLNRQNVKVVNELEKDYYDAVCLLVRHNEYNTLFYETILGSLNESGVILDYCNFLHPERRIIKV